MKNLIEPQTLAFFKSQPVPYKDIVEFLDNNPQFNTSQLASLIGIKPKNIYDWKFNQKRRNKTSSSSQSVSSVSPKSRSQKGRRYSAEDKFNLFLEYSKSSEERKSQILREYGLYSSDISRWEQKIKSVSLDVLGKNKIRSDKKTPEQIKIQDLEKELKEQEKTTAKLSTLLMLQKKTFSLLKEEG